MNLDQVIDEVKAVFPDAKSVTIKTEMLKLVTEGQLQLNDHWQVYQEPLSKRYIREEVAKKMKNIKSALGGYGRMAAGWGEESEIPIQGGLSNKELIEKWNEKLPGVEPSLRELSAFAIGIEVGMSRCKQLGMISEKDLDALCWRMIERFRKIAGEIDGSV
jgi:hypothetical protein